MYQNRRLTPGLRGIRSIREHVVQFSHAEGRSPLCAWAHLNRMYPDCPVLVEVSDGQAGF
jgi:hypothetical protein